MFASRLSGTVFESLPGDALPGEFVMRPGTKRLMLNGQAARPGDMLLCDAEGACRVDGSVFSFDRAACFPEETDAIDRLGAEVEGWAHQLGWEGLIGAGVVDPGWEEDLGKHPLEDAIKECLPYLRNVFHKPIRHLRIDTETVLTAKARRIAKGAPDYLAAHPEDWDGRTVLGVKPKRILAKVRHEELDIYENRLAARLVDHLSRFLASRIRRLREIEGMLATVGDFGDRLRGHHRLQERISLLWADATQTSRHLHEARELASRLTRLRAQLLGLMDSELYENVPRRARIAGRIRMTNILRNDPNYRYVAQLWQRWFESAAQSVETEADFYIRMQKLHGRFASVVAMYVARGLDQLGFTTVASDGDLTEPGHEVVVKQADEPGISLSLCCGDDRALSIGIDGQMVLRFVPVFLGFLDILTDRSAHVSVESLRSRGESGVPCVLVYPGSLASGRSSLSRELQAGLTFNKARRPGQAGEIGFLPVSPYDITSVERLARCLTWHVLSRHFLKYPLVIGRKACTAIEHEDFRELAQQAVLECEKGLCVKSILNAERLNQMIETKCGQLERKASAFESTLTELEGIQRGRHHDPGLKGKLRAAKERKKSASEELDDLKRAGAELDAAISYTRSLATCRCCGTVNTGPHDSEYRSNATFEIRCSGCGCSWGLAVCGGCHERYPYIRVARIEDCLPGAEEPGWQEMSVGQDMLATPRHLEDGSAGFECPWCGHV
jgi:hypothetical protein